MLRQWRQLPFKPRKAKGYYECLSLEQQGNYDIPPYKPPSTEILGIKDPSPQDNDKSNDRDNYSSTSSEASTDSSIYTTDSGSLYTIRIYNRLEGRWEEPKPLPLYTAYPPSPRYEQWRQQEEIRHASEPHPTHNNYHRPFYCEYHQLRVYNNDTDSPFGNYSDNSESTSDTSTSVNDNNTESNESSSGDSSSLTTRSNKLQYYPDHIYTTSHNFSFEFDSDGDFPLSNSTISSPTSSHCSSYQYTGYATQNEELLDVDPILCPCWDPVRGRWNKEYWHHINDTSHQLQGVHLPSSSLHPRTQDTTERITASTRHLEPAPRQHLRLLAARKTVNTAIPSYKPTATATLPRHRPLLAARKSTLINKSIIRRESTITQTAHQPDTTTSFVRTHKTHTRRTNKRVYEKSTSDSDTTKLTFPPRRFKRNPNV